MSLNSLIFIGELDRGLLFTHLRQMFALMFAALYKLIGFFLEIVYAVAGLDNSSTFTPLYEGIQNRFYVIIGVFMLFKVTMSLITYFANPDKITDKEMGAGKLVTRFITMLILLIIVPQYIFPFLSRIQAPLLSTVGKVIMDSDTALNSDDTLSSETAVSAGENIANTIFAGFFHKNEDCNDSEDENYTKNLLDTAVTLAGEACDNDKGTYKYEFNFISAFLCVVPILILLLVIGVQVAIRAFKLILLKMIAPIPIISYMDPKSTKEGGRTSVYMKMFITTYLDLLIHFGALFFVIEIIDLSIADLSDIGKTFLGLAGETKIFGMVFVIIGLLLFASQAPKFVKKALGLKDSEFGSGLAGLLTTTAATAGMVGSGVAGFKAAATGGGNLIQNFGSGISSAISGGRAGYKAAGDKSDYTKVLGGIRARNAELVADRAAGVTAGHHAREVFLSTLTGKGPGAKLMSEVEALDDGLKKWNDLKSAIDSESSKGKYGTVRTDKVTGYDWIYGKSKDFAGVASVAKSQQKSEFEYNYTDERGVTHNQTIQTKDADWIQSELAKAESSKLFSMLTGNIDPEEARHIDFNDDLIARSRADNPDLLGKYGALAKSYEMGDLRTVIGADMEIYFNKLGDQMKLVEQRSLNTKNSTEYLAAQAAAKKNK